MRAADLEQVRPLELFRDLREAQFERLTRGGYVQNFPPQIELITEGDPADFLHILVSGSVELYSAWSGRECVMATVRPVSTFILAATVRDAPYLMSARSLEKSRIILLPSIDVREVLASSPEFAVAILVELATCYRSVVKHAKDLKLRSSVERLANYLIRQQNKNGGAAQFDLTTEKKRIASYLGMTAENLSRAIRTLEPYGLVVDGQRVTLMDPAALKRLAKPTPLIDDPAH